MRPPKNARPTPLPAPSRYRQSVPAFPVDAEGPSGRRTERKRKLYWFAVAVGLHAALFVGWWLTPPLRLKWNPSPDQWVEITSLPVKPPANPTPHPQVIPINP